MEVNTKTRAFLAGLCGMAVEEKLDIVAFYASRNSLNADALMKVAAELEVSEAESLQKAAEKRQKKAQGVEDERVRGLILASKSLEEVLPHVAYAISRKKEVTVNVDGSFDTSLRASRQGNTSGKGRPKKDAPTGFQNKDGEEILGGIATFVKEGVENDTFSPELLASLFTEGGNMRSKEKVTAALLVSGNIVATVDTAEETEDTVTE